MRPLAPHQFSLRDVNPLDPVSIAAEVGCQRIVIWVNFPGNPAWGKRWPWPDYDDIPMTAPSMNNATRQRLDETGIELANVELFPISENVDPEGNRPVLELGYDRPAGRSCRGLEPDAARRRGLVTA